MPFAAIRARGPVEDADAAVQTCAEVSAKHNVFLHLVDPEVVYNERHLESAWAHAERSKQEARMTARTIEAEFLMYLTGQRQVSVALPLAGVRNGMPELIVCAAGERAATAIWGLLDKMGWSRVSAGVGTNAGALDKLGCEPRYAHPEDAVLEKVALVDLIK